MSVSDSAAGPRRAWGWVQHLLDGGTTRWSVFEGEAPREPGFLPGAQQLELLRRLNELGPELGRPSYDLAQRVLHTSGTGRGQQHLDLVGVRDRSSFGSPPVRPREIPSEEMHRVAAAVLADLAVTTAMPEPPEWPRARVRRTRYRLGGDPLLARSVRLQLRGHGWPPGGRRPVAVMALCDYATYLGDVWTVKARQGDASTWRLWLDHRFKQPGLPGPLDLERQCGNWADTVGADRVHLAFEVRDVRRLLGCPRLVAPPRPSHASTEGMRQVGQALRPAVQPPERRARMTQVVQPWFDRAEAGLPGSNDLARPRIPRHMTGWVDAEARRIHEALLEAGYPVLGADGLERLLPTLRASGPSGSLVQHHEQVLALMLRAMHAAGGGR